MRSETRRPERVSAVAVEALPEELRRQRREESGRHHDGQRQLDGVRTPRRQRRLAQSAPTTSAAMPDNPASNARNRPPVIGLPCTACESDAAMLTSGIVIRNPRMIHTLVPSRRDDHARIRPGVISATPALAATSGVQTYSRRA